MHILAVAACLSPETTGNQAMCHYSYQLLDELSHFDIHSGACEDKFLALQSAGIMRVGSLTKVHL